MPRAAVNGINLYYQVHGTGDPVIMVQGFGGVLQGWFFQTRAFKKHFQVIIFDNRGLGKTDGRGTPFTIETMADDTVGLLDHLGIERAHVVGMSLGGIVAQEVAINHPQRVNKLVLTCTTSGEAQGSDLHPEVLKVLGMKEGDTMADVRAADIGKTFTTITGLGYNKWRWRTFVVPLAKYHLRREGVEPLYAQMEAVAGHTTTDRLHLIKSPTLVMAGSGDRVIPPRASEVMAEKIPNARLVMLEGGSHACLMEMRGRYNREILDFLKDS